MLGLYGHTPTNPEFIFPELKSKFTFFRLNLFVAVAVAAADSFAAPPWKNQSQDILTRINIAICKPIKKREIQLHKY